MNARRILFAMFALAHFGIDHAVAEDAPDPNEATLTGDWGGMRTRLTNAGVTLEFIHKSDVLAIAAGGLQRGAAWMGNTEAGLDIDLEVLLGWRGANAHIHYHSQLGAKFDRDYVGSFMGVDNIENGTNTAQFDGAWIEQALADDRLSLLAGLYAVDTEFKVTETSGLFLQPPYGASNEMAQPIFGAPQAAPVFPVGALALRARYATSDGSFYAQYALTDGVPGDPDEPRGTHIRLDERDGTFSILELGSAPQANEGGQAAAEGTFNKTAVGFWRYSERFDDPVDVDDGGDPRRRRSQGMYFLVERTLLREKADGAQGLSGFVRFGTASRNLHQADWVGSVGLIYQGLLAGRGEDVAGIAVTVNHASSKYRRLNDADRAQTSYEATYRAQIAPWFALIPTLQYFHNPNMDPGTDNTWIVGSRAEIAF